MIRSFPLHVSDHVGTSLPAIAAYVASTNETLRCGDRRTREHRSAVKKSRTAHSESSSDERALGIRSEGSLGVFVSI
jgi:hypothetical protein